jgi:hypothetical protein
MADEPRIVGQVDALAIPRFAGVRTFARLPERDATGRPDIAVLGAPFDGGGPANAAHELVSVMAMERAARSGG